MRSERDSLKRLWKRWARSRRSHAQSLKYATSPLLASAASGRNRDQSSNGTRKVIEESFLFGFSRA